METSICDICGAETYRVKGFKCNHAPYWHGCPCEYCVGIRAKIEAGTQRA